MRLDWWLD